MRLHKPASPLPLPLPLGLFFARQPAWDEGYQQAPCGFGVACRFRASKRKPPASLGSRMVHHLTQFMRMNRLRRLALVVLARHMVRQRGGLHTMWPACLQVTW